MAKKHIDGLGTDNRYLIFLVFAVLVLSSFFLFAALFGPEEPEVRTYVNEDGLTVNEYYYPYSPNPFRVEFSDSDGNMVQTWYDRNTNGKFESKVYFQDGVMINQDVSLVDDGIYDLKRLIEGDNVLEKYDRNRDGYWEEKHIIRNHITVEQSIDRNGDGNDEQKVLYDAQGRVKKMILDNNSDGKPDFILPHVDASGNPIPFTGSSAPLTGRRKGPDKK